ncbi:insulin receptor substrate 2 isoform X2 [Erythrolamprus reginae]|uniref:insulin receptor substrate 2 isoform X2 n=1 Tax=Erythrolamprus reginae TaxID=121349 RepID=UPI00396C4D80
MAASPAPESPSSSSAGPNLNNNNNNNNNQQQQQQQQEQQQPPPGVRKCGYLRKQKHGHKRFFVLRAPDGGAAAGEEASPQQPARLEYYESEKKWRSKSTAPKRTIALDACLNVHKRADAKHKHLIALYTRDEYFALAAESEPEQEAWYQAITELLHESQAAAQGSLRHPSHLASCEDFSSGHPGCRPPAPAAYREVWQVTLKPKGLGQSRNLTGVHRLCLAAHTVGLVRLNCDRPCVTLQLMNIRRCGHSDSFFFMELGRSASTGPGELWMQADDSVVAQNIHETILEAMKALRELVEFRPRSKSQSSSSSSGGATTVGVNAGGGGGGGGALSSMCSRPISVPGRRHHAHHPLAPLPPSQTGLLRRSRTDILTVAGSSGSSSSSSSSHGSRVRTASESDGIRADSLSGSPLSPETGQITPHSLGVRGAPSPLGGQAAIHSGGSLALGHSSFLGPKLTAEPSLASQRLSSCSASGSGSPSDLAGFMTFEELGSSPAGDLLPLSSSSATSHPSNTPETPPGWQLDGYIAMEREPLRHQPYLCGEDKVPRKRTYSLTTPVHQGSLPPPVSSASLDEYTLMQATFSRAGYSPKTTYTPYPEDYCDVDIGCSGIGSDRPHLGCSVPKGDGYMPMSPSISSVVSLQTDSDGYMSMHPTSVSTPQQIAQSYSYKINRESSPDNCGYMHMWGTRTRLPGESPEERLASDDYISMSPLLLPPSASDSPMLSTDHFSALRLGNQSGYLGSLLHACQQSDSHGERKDSDQYVLMNSPTGRQNYTPKGKFFLAPCNNTAVHLSMQHNQTETSFNQKTGNTQPSHPSLGLLLPIMTEQPLLKESQSSSGDYVDIGYSLVPTYKGLSSLFNPGLGGHNGSRISSYMNLNFDSPQTNPISLGPLEEILMPGSCPNPKKLDKHYLKVGMQMACLSSPTSEAGDYAEMIFNTATAPPQPISHKPESVCVTGPGPGLKQLTLPEVETFVFASPPFDPNHGAKVIRVDPQGRRRHSSETFLSTTTVTPVSPSFAHHPKRQNSASVENVSLRKNEGLGGEEQNSSPMCRETSAGFQNGLNYIAVDALDGSDLAVGDQVEHKDRYTLNGNINSTYASISVLAQHLKKTSLVKE